MTPLIILLGATGFIGEAFEAELQKRHQSYMPLSRKTLDYTRLDTLLKFLRETRPAFLINAAGYTGKPNVDACESARAETLEGNTLFPQTVAHACAAANVPWGHVSSGCIYSGARIKDGAGGIHVEKSLTRPDLIALRKLSPERILGFTETDPPNFSFRDPPCSFYSGTKALAEEKLAHAGQCYLWRLRIPFDEFDSPRNFLSKVQRYAKAYDNVNSISHRGDFVRACLDLWKLRAPFGIYNVTNPGFITTRRVVEYVEQILRPARPIEFWEGDEEFYRVAAKTPRSNCVLDVSKLLAAGVRIRPVEEAVQDSLHHWKLESPHAAALAAPARPVPGVPPSSQPHTDQRLWSGA